MPSIYDAQLSDELQDYTLNLLSYLNQRGYMTTQDVHLFINNHVNKQGVFQKSYEKCSFVVQRGRLSRCCDKHCEPNSEYCKAHKNPTSIELEYIILNGLQYYYDMTSSSVYSYHTSPKLIGKLDHDTLTIICVSDN